MKKKNKSPKPNATTFHPYKVTIRVKVASLQFSEPETFLFFSEKADFPRRQEV